MKTKLFLIIGLIFCTSLIACRATYVHDRPAEVVYRRPAAPSPDYVWVSGNWIWKAGRYTWHEGYWQKRRTGATWVDGHWNRTRRGWVWEPGHWRRF